MVSRLFCSVCLLGLGLACSPFPEDTSTPPAAPAPAPEQESPQAATPAPMESYWGGGLALGGDQKLEFFAYFHEGKTGWEAELSIPGQATFNVPLQGVQITDESVSFRLEAVGASWRWDRASDGRTCEFQQGSARLGCSVAPITKELYAEATTLRRPQTPKPPYAYEVEEVSYLSLDQKTKLAGTLTRPSSPGKHPAVILITGSGAQDRDETIFEHKPFAVLADTLTRRGITVLRVDDRGVGGSGGELEGGTMAERGLDVRGGLKFLRDRDDIDPKRIGLLGHSEGASIGMTLAADKKLKVAFLVMIAGPGVPGLELMLRQGELIEERAGLPAEAVAESRKWRRGLYQIYLDEPDPKKADPLLTAYTQEKLASLEGVAKAEIDAQIRGFNTPSFREILRFDPAQHLRKVRCPTLAIGGKLDLQVESESNLEGIEKALKKARNKAVETKLFPGLNHLLQRAKTGLPNEYIAIEETIAPEALEAIASWMQTHAKVDKS